SLTQAPGSAITVTLQAGGSAAFSGPLTDYSVTGTGVSFDTVTGVVSVNFSAGQPSATVTIVPASTFPVADPADTITLTVQNGTGYSVGPGATASETIPANGTLVTNTSDSGEGSFRQAIINADNIPGGAIITFAIPTTDPGFSGTPGTYNPGDFW